MKTSLLTRLLGPLVVGIVLLGTVAIAQADPLQPLPHAGGTLVEELTIGPVPMESGALSLTLQRPTGWTSLPVADGVLIRPAINPGDVGVVAMVWPLDNPNGVGLNSETAMAVFSGWVTELVVAESSLVSIKDAAGKDVSATLVVASGRFNDGRAGHFFLLHVFLVDGVVVVAAGASDEVFGPFEHALRDILLTASVYKAP